MNSNKDRISTRRLVEIGIRQKQLQKEYSANLDGARELRRMAADTTDRGTRALFLKGARSLER